jgi:hypothetical protein
MRASNSCIGDWASALSHVQASCRRGRSTQTIAGVAAAAARQWKAAEDHFQTALQQAESFPNRLERAEIRRFPQ